MDTIASVEMLAGRARVLGDDISMDYLISSTRKQGCADPRVLRKFLLEDLDAGFAASVRAGDVLVAGENFGCGAAADIDESAVAAILDAGIRVVFARSFAGAFRHIAARKGLLPIAGDTRFVREGDELGIMLTPAKTEVIIGWEGRVIACA
jgi:3-isopropylmalate/(R)-2-methylmalate dehydratase small subunit